MQLTSVWILPLCVGAAGAVALASVAALLRRDVTELQRSLRPLRVPVSRRAERDRPR